MLIIVQWSKSFNTFHAYTEYNQFMFAIMLLIVVEIVLNIQ